MLRSWFHRMRSRADRLNREQILELLEPNSNAALLDLGCDNGDWTLALGKRIGTADLHGLDVVGERLEEAARRGIQTHQGDLNGILPFADSSFDGVHANQVIEHLADTDRFLAEIVRILKPGGYCVLSTENLASWCNLASLALGWQPFSLTNVSASRLGIGNPLAINRGQSTQYTSWLHLRVFAYRGLVELLEGHGLRVERVLGSGYFPLPAPLGRFDPRHAHFLALKARRPF
ncbi:MAG: methyltransferase domain-containing protein [Candidatus Omnitrophica bacterium]|nr:methyltransferase domain-containing protein [Candidatus Omnitrophota bacterium]